MNFLVRKDKDMSANWKCITAPAQSFAGIPICTQLDELEADIAIIGLHYVSPYPQKFPATAIKSALETSLLLLLIRRLWLARFRA